MSRYGYLLLSAALESASGKRFSDLLAESVAGPAGMGSTMIDDPRRFLPGRSLFYERGVLRLLRAARPVDTSCRSGAGGLLSTTEDLVRYGAALLRGELLRPRSLDAMFSTRKTRTGADTGYGLGWYVETDGHRAARAPGDRHALQHRRTSASTSTPAASPRFSSRASKPPAALRTSSAPRLPTSPRRPLPTAPLPRRESRAGFPVRAFVAKRRCIIGARPAPLVIEQLLTAQRERNDPSPRDPCPS